MTSATLNGFSRTSNVPMLPPLGLTLLTGGGQCGVSEMQLDLGHRGFSSRLLLVPAEPDSLSLLTAPSSVALPRSVTGLNTQAENSSLLITELDTMSGIRPASGRL